MADAAVTPSPPEVTPSATCGCFAGRLSPVSDIRGAVASPTWTSFIASPTVDRRPGRRLDEGDRRAEALLLRERVLAEFDTGLPRDLGGHGREGGVDLALERSERVVHGDEFSGCQRLRRAPATGRRERVERRRDAVEPGVLHTFDCRTELRHSWKLSTGEEGTFSQCAEVTFIKCADNSSAS